MGIESIGYLCLKCLCYNSGDKRYCSNCGADSNRLEKDGESPEYKQCDFFSHCPFAGGSSCHRGCEKYK